MNTNLTSIPDKHPYAMLLLVVSHASSPLSCPYPVLDPAGTVLRAVQSPVFIACTPATIQYVPRPGGYPYEPAYNVTSIVVHIPCSIFDASTDLSGSQERIHKSHRCQRSSRLQASFLQSNADDGTIYILVLFCDRDSLPSYCCRVL